MPQRDDSGVLWSMSLLHSFPVVLIRVRVWMVNVRRLEMENEEEALILSMPWHGMLNIFQHLDAESLARSGRVCKRWYHTSSQDVFVCC